MVANVCPDRCLERLLPQRDDLSAPVLVIGAGKVGQAAVKALLRKGLRVHVIDPDRVVARATGP